MCQYSDPITNINVEIGEIKKSGGKDAMIKGCRQLMLRLAVLSFAVQALFKNPRCNMTGILFVTKNGHEVSSPEWDGVKFPDFPESNFYKNIMSVTVGSKYRKIFTIHNSFSPCVRW